MDVREVWDRLAMTRELVFEARSRASTMTGWVGVGRGTVRVESADGSTMLFHEKGTWTSQDGREIGFNNVYRWTAEPDGRLIRLEHLRFGPAEPVYLFDLIPIPPRVLESAEPHVCREDLYSARMEYDDAAVRLCWTITGPQKDETIVYTYR